MRSVADFVNSRITIFNPRFAVPDAASIHFSMIVIYSRVYDSNLDDIRTSPSRDIVFYEQVQESFNPFIGPSTATFVNGFGSHP
jgi:hypothetical protein